MRKPKNRKLSFARNRASLTKQARSNLSLRDALYRRYVAKMLQRRGLISHSTAQGGAK